MKNETTIHFNASVRMEAVSFTESVNSNINGNTHDGMPRIDHQTQRGLNSDVSTKRPIRDHTRLRVEEGDLTENFDIYIQSETFLQNQRRDIYGQRTMLDYVLEVAGHEPPKGLTDDDLVAWIIKPLPKNKTPKDQSIAWAVEFIINNITDAQKRLEIADRLQQEFCKKFVGVRWFGAVASMSKFNLRQLKGPLQLAIGQTEDPIHIHNLQNVRVSREKPGDKKKKEAKAKKVNEADDDIVADMSDGRQYGTFADCYRVAYGLYRQDIYYNPRGRVHTTDADMEAFWEAFVDCRETQRSRAKVGVHCREIYVFVHTSKFGEAPSHCLLESVHAELRDKDTYPRAYSDYKVWLDKEKIQECWPSVKVVHIKDGVARQVI